MSNQLDDLSGVPRYLQIARKLESEIRAGTWTPGKPAPSRSQLAGDYGVARETVAHAHARLAECGYLVSVAGVGMVVTPSDRWPDKPSV